MRRKKNNNGAIRQAVFLLTIDFNYQARDRFGKLQARRYYTFSKLGKESNYHNEIGYRDIVDYVTNIVGSELKSQCQECIDTPIEQVKVLKTYEGSINIIFSVIFNALGVVSGLKDLYDCIQLIKVVSDAHIKKRLEDQYGDVFDTGIRTIVPDWERFYHTDDRYETRSLIKHSNRDIFFYYLLISNIVLLIVIGLLVFKAVQTMYC